MSLKVVLYGSDSIIVHYLQTDGAFLSAYK